MEDKKKKFIFSRIIAFLIIQLPLAIMTWPGLLFGAIFQKYMRVVITITWFIGNYLIILELSSYLPFPYSLLSSLFWDIFIQWTIISVVGFIALYGVSLIHPQ